MKPVGFLVLILVTMVSIVVLNQIQFLNDLIAAAGYTPTEVWSGAAGVLVLLYTVLLVTSK